MCLVIPIYLFTGISVIFSDFIIINNLDYDYYRYSDEKYFIGIGFVFLESYVFSLIAVAIHNNIIKERLVFSFFSKGIIIYFFFYIATYLDFILHFIEHVIPLWVAVFLILFVYVFYIVMALTAWLWILYLPNISTKDKHSFFYIVKNSYGARLTIIVQAIYITLIFGLMFALFSYIGGENIGLIYTLPIMILFCIITLSHTYLGWKKLEAETNKL